MDSDNPSGAGNQQERPGIEQWVVGFVDGEGCFSISVVRNPGCLLGWQVQHEFRSPRRHPRGPHSNSSNESSDAGRSSRTGATTIIVIRSCASP
jgi:hypothetical protein